MSISARGRWAVIERIKQLGITERDAIALRRIALTLHRWYELECGDGNEYGSWAIERNDACSTLCTQCGHNGWDTTDRCAKCGGVAIVRQEGDDLPYLVRHYYGHGRGNDSATRTRIPDRETGAKKRLEKILARYPGLTPYIQTDPRGASLYLVTVDTLARYQRPIDQMYSHGVAIY